VTRSRERVDTRVRTDLDADGAGEERAVRDRIGIERGTEDRDSEGRRAAHRVDRTARNALAGNAGATVRDIEGELSVVVGEVDAAGGD
jgi:hypothetical protein